MSKAIQLTVLASVLLLAAGASAQEINPDPGAQKKASIGLLFGNGFGFDDPNGWALGVGARGGYNIDAIYLGGRFVYHFGTSTEVLGISSGVNLWEAGVEGGYDFRLSRQFSLRPEVGAGVATRIASVGLADISTTMTNPYLAFGASGLFDLSQSFFLGANGRLELVLGDGSPAAAVLMLNGGMRF